MKLAFAQVNFCLWVFCCGTFRDFRWVGPYIVQKALPNDNYIVRKSNKTQILHRIRLKKFIPKKPIIDSYQNEKLQLNDDIIIPQDDLYTVAWKTNFGNQINENSDSVSTTVSDRLQQYEADIAAGSTTTRIGIESESKNPNNNVVNDRFVQRDATNNNDVTPRTSETSENQRVSDLSKQR